MWLGQTSHAEFYFDDTLIFLPSSLLFWTVWLVFVLYGGYLCDNKQQQLNQVIMAPSIHLSSLSCLLLSSLYAPTAAFKYERAQSVPQILGRQDFLGGWVDGIPGTTCPSDVPVQCTGIISNPACCPKGTFCLGLGEQYCCPTSTYFPNPSQPTHLKLD